MKLTQRLSPHSIAVLILPGHAAGQLGFDFFRGGQAVFQGFRQSLGEFVNRHMNRFIDIGALGFFAFNFLILATYIDALN